MRRQSALGWQRRPVFVVGVICALLVPQIGLDDVWEGIALLVVINASVALGMTLLFGHAGQLSITQAGMMGIGAYVTGIASVTLGLSPWIGLVMGIVLAMAVALVIGYPVLRLQGLYLAMATLAINLILIAIAIEEESLTGGALGFVGLEPLEFFGSALDEPGKLYYPALAAFLILFLMSYRLVESPIGAMLSALRHDERAATLSGINVPILKTKTFVLSAAFAAVGGFFLAEYLLFVPPESYGLVQSLYFLVMVVVGGMRSLSGAVVGAAFITIVPQLVPGDPILQQFIFASAFLLITMFAPNGIVGLVTAIWQWIYERIRGAAGTGSGRAGGARRSNSTGEGATGVANP